MNILTNYTMELYHLHRLNHISKTASHNIQFVEPWEGVLNSYTCRSSMMSKTITKNVKRGISGMLAVSGGEIVGYGWIKFKGDYDKFYRFGSQVAYLSEFFVKEDFRGNGIYPALISKLILSHGAYDEFYISAYTTNIASRKGLEKVGFQKIDTLKFTRFLKITFNKHKILNRGQHL